MFFPYSLWLKLPESTQLLITCRTIYMAFSSDDYYGSWIKRGLLRFQSSLLSDARAPSVVHCYILFGFWINMKNSR